MPTWKLKPLLRIMTPTHLSVCRDSTESTERRNQGSKERAVRSRFNTQTLVMSDGEKAQRRQEKGESMVGRGSDRKFTETTHICRGRENESPADVAQRGVACSGLIQFTVTVTCVTGPDRPAPSPLILIIILCFFPHIKIFYFLFLYLLYHLKPQVGNFGVFFHISKLPFYIINLIIHF